jgi:hypothetical protein
MSTYFGTGQTQKKGEPSGSPFSWNFEYPSPRSFATKIFPIKIRIRPFPSTLAPSCASYTSMRRSLSFYPNLLYILHTAFLFLRLSLSDSADVPFPRSIICCTSCYSFANPLACPSFVLGLLVHAN